MAKKKHNSLIPIPPFFKTRIGFYVLSLSAIILMVGSIKAYATYPTDSDVLGEKSEKASEMNREEEKKNEEDTKEASKKQAEAEKEREKKKQEIANELRSEPEKIKIKYEQKNGNVKRKIEIQREGDEFQYEDKEEIEDEIEEEFENEHEAEVASGSSEVTLKKNKIKAKIGFPLSIDLATNSLIVTKPDGSTKEVTILPDQAVENFMRHKKVNLINVPTDDDNSSTDSATTTPDDDSIATSSSDTDGESTTEVSLIEKNDELVYEIKGKKKLRVFGLIPVNVDTTGYVSAETGDVVDQQESLFTRLLNLISL